MKKLTALTLVGMMAVSSVATASQSRWNGFGASRQFIADVQNAWTLPSSVASNADATYFEFGTAAVNPDLVVANTAYKGFAGAGAWGGSHMTLGPGVLAIWGNRPYMEGSNIDTGYLQPTGIISGTASPAAFLTPRQTIDLIYAFGIGEAATIGIGINSANNETKTETTSTAGGTTVTSQSSGDFGVNLGAGIKDLGAISLLEFGIQYNMYAATNSHNDGIDTNKASRSGTDIDVRLGMDIKGEGSAFQRIELGVNMDTLTLKREPSTRTGTLASTAYVQSDNGAMAWNLGWVMGKSSDKGMGLGGFTLVGMGQTRSEAYRAGSEINKRDASSLTLAFVSGGEGKIKEWLTARAGISTNLWGTTSTVTDIGASGATTKTTTSGPAAPATTLSAGLSFIFGDITIDGVLNQDVLYTGTYFVSGIPAALNSQVSATWGWGGSKE